MILNAHYCLLVKDSIGRVHMESFIWLIVENETDEVSVSDLKVSDSDFRNLYFLNKTLFFF